LTRKNGRSLLEGTWAGKKRKVTPVRMPPGTLLGKNSLVRPGGKWGGPSKRARAEGKKSRGGGGVNKRESCFFCFWFCWWVGRGPYSPEEKCGAYGLGEKWAPGGKRKGRHEKGLPLVSRGKSKGKRGARKIRWFTEHKPREESAESFYPSETAPEWSTSVGSSRARCKRKEGRSTDRENEEGARTLRGGNQHQRWGKEDRSVAVSKKGKPRKKRTGNEKEKNG